MNKNTLILTAVVALLGFNAMFSPGGNTRAIATGVIDNPDQSFTIGFFGKCIGVSNNMDLVAVTHSGASGTYYTLRCDPGAGTYELTTRNTSYFEVQWSNAQANDDINDSVVGVFIDDTNKDLYVNGTFVAEVTNTSTLSEFADDFCIMSQCRSTSPSGGFRGIYNHAWYCGREMTADEIAEYHNNVYDKDYIRQLCNRVPGTQLLFYPMTDMYVVEPGTAGGAGGKYVHENGYPIKDLGEDSHHLITIAPTAGNPNTDFFFLTGTFDLQN